MKNGIWFCWFLKTFTVYGAGSGRKGDKITLASFLPKMLMSVMSNQMATVII